MVSRCHGGKKQISKRDIMVFLDLTRRTILDIVTVVILGYCLTVLDVIYMPIKKERCVYIYIFGCLVKVLFVSCNFRGLFVLAVLAFIHLFQWKTKKPTQM